MRFTLNVVLVTAVFAAAACGNGPDQAGELPEADTNAGSVAPPASEVGTSPDDADSAGRATGSAEHPDTTADSADRAGASDRGDGEVAATIPARVHGEWNADLSACGTGRSDSRLRISASEVRFYESTGTVRSVEIESDREIVVTAEYQGEGETWQDERRMMLSEDGSSLTVSNGGDLVRYRCP